MGSIDGLSISISLQQAAQAAPSQRTRAGRAADQDGDDDGGARVPHGHGHGDARGQGSLQNALMQALQSLGLTGSTAGTTTAPTDTTTSTTSTATSSTTPAPGASASDPVASPGNAVSAADTLKADTLKADIRSFMHALFQAVRAAQSVAPGTSTTVESAGSTPVVADGGATPAPGTSAPSITIQINIGTQAAFGGHSRFGEHQGRHTQFAGGLGAVISQASNNQAPTPLQDAFAKVLADLQPAAPASGANDAGGTGTGTGTQVTLQALLTQLQQNLGYGAAGSASPLGNSVNTVV